MSSVATVGDRAVRPVGRPEPCGWQDAAVREIPITTDEIRLGQLLKLAGIVEQGSDARVLLAGGGVMVIRLRSVR